MYDFISDDLKHGKQSWTREATVQLGKHKLRVTIKRDAYDFQSQIYVEVWSPEQLQWNRVRSLEGTDYDDLPSYVVTNDVQIIQATNELMLELFNYAGEILA